MNKFLFALAVVALVGCASANPVEPNAVKAKPEDLAEVENVSHPLFKEFCIAARDRTFAAVNRPEHSDAIRHYFGVMNEENNLSLQIFKAIASAIVPMFEAVNRAAQFYKLFDKKNGDAEINHICKAIGQTLRDELIEKLNETKKTLLEGISKETDFALWNKISDTRLDTVDCQTTERVSNVYNFCSSLKGWQSYLAERKQE